ncbi:FAD/NAD(P)-binding oxidoreductase family protein [Actinidia rufa]|uniref:FAD/NAD(P)-binding oxidoreductase family protein n=1 Tax=Actinidia rufa TaxID=165716 RepID=A0A7J0GA86_9ERIC|nr:FAD/NAD(P)-binding oxidoreductase family protein [Actinidia rufa]
MSSAFPRFILHVGISSKHPQNTAIIPLLSQKSSEELLVVVGDGAAWEAFVKDGRCNMTNGHCVDNLVSIVMFMDGAVLRLFWQNIINKELKGSFFRTHGPKDTMSWFSDHGVELKTEDDGRVFPVSNNSSSVVDWLLSEAKQRGGYESLLSLRIVIGMIKSSNLFLASSTFRSILAKVATTASVNADGNVSVDYLLVASGSIKQVAFCDLFFDIVD